MTTIVWILQIVATLFFLGLVVVVHELGHLVVALRLKVRVEKFTVGFGPEIFGWTWKGIRYCLCAIPLGGMVKMAGEYAEERENKPDEFFSQPWYKRNMIALAGPVMNYVLAFVLFAMTAAIWGTLQPSSSTVIGDLALDMPAAKAGLQIGDQILKIDGQEVRSWDEMARIIHDKPEQNVVLDIMRPQDKSTASPYRKITIRPKKDEQLGIGLIGIVPKVDKVKPGFVGSLKVAVNDLKVWTVQPVKYLAQKLVRLEGPKELSGPLGIAQMVTKATKEGVAYVMYLMAIISTGLGLFNLFPIPVLDGGHILLYTIEGIIRRPLSKRALQIAHAIGLSVVLTIFLYASYQDVLRWRLGFWK